MGESDGIKNSRPHQLTLDNDSKINIDNRTKSMLTLQSYQSASRVSLSVSSNTAGSRVSSGRRSISRTSELPYMVSTDMSTYLHTCIQTATHYNPLSNCLID